MSMWRDRIWQIRNLKMDLAKVDPTVGPAIAPHPGATPRAIVAVERRIRRRLPPSYRAFLAEHDGWPLFFQGATLLGTHELARGNHAELAEAAFGAYETPLPELGPPARPKGDVAQMIPFGLDPHANLLFAFNPAVLRPDGEMEVILWVNGLGERRESFTQLLDFVLDMLQADLAEKSVSARRTA
jgi:hypothetical protein